MSEINLDLALASAILRDGKEGWQNYLATDIDVPLIDHDYQELFSFLYDYAETYEGEVPSPAVVEARFPGITLPDVKEPISFFADYVTKRALHGGLQSLLVDASSELKSQRPEQAYDILDAGLHKLRKEKLIDNKITSVAEFADEWVSYHEKIASGWRGIPTPWPTLTEATLGLWPGDLVVLAARSGVGKTWAALLFAVAAWQAGKTVLFATTELTQFRIAMRLFALMSGIPYRKHLLGKLDTVDQQRMFEARDQFKQMERFFVIGGNFDFRPETLASAIYDIKPDLAIFDGGYLMKSAGANRMEQAANAFNTFKPQALRSNIPIIVTTQFNRGVKTNQVGTVDAGNVALTDAALWNCDLMLALYQDEDMYLDKVMKVIKLKARETVFKDFMSRWDFDAMEFCEVPEIMGDAAEFGTGLPAMDDTTGF